MDYKLMCFPCLRRKKKLSSFESSSTDFDDRFEYIVDKYTIRKIPMIASHTPEESLRRQTQQDLDAKFIVLQDAAVEKKDIGDFTSISLLPEAYSVPRVTSVMPVITHSSRTVKEKLRPADILDSTSQIPRRTTMKPNYVVIPSKASLHAKDIMLTKREITNQYLNNFSSVFVDNLKDQVPKDPETLPKLSRPYTSAMKNLCVGGNIPKTSRRRDSCRGKVQKLVYSLPDGNIVETGYEPDGGSNHTVTDDENIVPVHSPGIHKDPVETISIPFKSTIKGQSSTSDNEGLSQESRPQSSQQTEITPSMKQITYEDIQALDVGYEFPNSEKFGVKPKMTRIRITNLDVERSKDIPSIRPGHATAVDSEFPRRLGDKSDKPHTQSHILPPQNQNFRNLDIPQLIRPLIDKEGLDDQQRQLRYFLADPCFLPHSINLAVKMNADGSKDSKSAYSEYSKDLTEDSNKADSEREINTRQFSVFGDGKMGVTKEIDYQTSSTEKFSESLPKTMKPCLKSQNRPSSVPSQRPGSYLTSASPRQKLGSIHHPSMRDPSIFYTPYKSAIVCKSHSFESLSSIKKEEQEHLNARAMPLLRFQDKRPEEPETETSNSIYSRESKTSSLVTSPVTSELEVGKKATTLRWKIIIKHHKDETKDKKGVTVGSNQ